MRSLTADTFWAFERWFAVPDSSAEDRRRRTYLAFSLIILIPIVLGFGVADLRQGSRAEGALVIALAVYLTGLLVALARVRELMPILRLGALATLLLQLYELRIGGGDGYAFLWFYCIPILAMTVFGRRQGTIWVLGALGSAVLGFLGPLGHAYELRTVLRFLVAYVIVAIFSYALESSRSRYYSELLEEKVSLEHALSQVKTLRGLLPLCARCKKVRSDEGYWQQIELFVDQHSETQFSHSLCPKCATRLYPDIPAELRSPGETPR